MNKPTIRHEVTDFEASVLQSLNTSPKKRGNQTQATTRVDASEFDAESLSLLSQKLELVDRLRRLEQGHCVVQALLQEYQQALSNAIVDKATTLGNQADCPKSCMRKNPTESDSALQTVRALGRR